MKLSQDAVISEAKMANYLLRRQPENDKSAFLALAGYTAARADRLTKDIRALILSQDAEFEKSTEYGDKYRIRGILTGPNGRILRVVSIWMVENETGRTKFVTLFPDKAK
jgi:hypothetical protein